jgi:hypothetical protein
VSRAAGYGDANNLLGSSELRCAMIFLGHFTPPLLILGLLGFNIANARKLASNISALRRRPSPAAFRPSTKHA